jgi:Zn-dependent peptidase ImmA (M78 family)
MVSVDFKMFGKGEAGIYYPNSERVIIYLNNHESMTDILKTIQHELIHAAIEKCDEEMDEDQEEKLIFFMAWSEEFLV